VASSEIILTAENLVAGYGGSAILHGVGLQISDNSICGIIGPNGAGKSTLLKVILGYLKPRPGKVHFLGEDVTSTPPHKRIARGIAYVGQSRSHFPSLTVRQNLRMGAYLVKSAALRRQREAAVFERFPILEQRKGQVAGLLSGGQVRMLEIGRMLMTDPKLIILDEPSIGLSPVLVEMVYEHILKLRQGGATVLIVEQNVRKLLTVADNIFAIESGQVRYQGTPSELTESGLLSHLYLGASIPSSDNAGPR
jgi:branched-chain amino acid transport system ATP-binding protein